MSYYRNPTESAAIGAVDREIRVLRKRAAQLRKLRKQGKLTQQELDRARLQFTGVYRRFLLEALAD